MQQLISIKKSLEKYQKTNSIPNEEELRKILESVREIAGNNQFLNSMLKTIETKIHMLKQRAN